MVDNTRWPAHPRAGTILVVDDDTAIAQLLVEVLSEEGYTVTSVSDGARALLAIVRHAPRLILLDLLMPGMGGAQMVQQLAAIGHRATPVVLMTASPQAAAPLLVPGRIVSLPKPFALDALSACVARFMHPVVARDRSDPLLFPNYSEHTPRVEPAV